MVDLSTRPHREVKPPLISGDDKALALCDYAASILKIAGFELNAISQKSEACYYKYPSINGLLRVATHRLGRTEARTFSMPVIASLTFTSTDGRSIENTKAAINLAVGKYFLYPLTSSSYDDIPIPQGIPLFGSRKKRIRAQNKAKELKDAYKNI